MGIIAAKPSAAVRFEKLLAVGASTSGLGEAERELIRNGYVALFSAAESNRRFYDLLGQILQYLITISAATVSTLLGLQVPEWGIHPGGASSSRRVVFWLTFILSFVVLMANKIMSTSDVQRKLAIERALCYKYAAEGRLFLAEVGRYANLAPGAAFTTFIDRVEHIAAKGAAAKLGGSAGAGDGTSHGDAGTGAARGDGAVAILASSSRGRSYSDLGAKNNANRGGRALSELRGASALDIRVETDSTSPLNEEGE